MSRIVLSRAEPREGGYRPIAVRPRRVSTATSASLSVTALAFALLLAGCGEANGDNAQTAPDDEPETSLTVALDHGDGAGAEEWTLTCDPAGGTHPDPEAACATLDEIDQEVLSPVPPDSACTMIYGGPQTATVTGSLRGEQINAEFSRENGCEIARWDAIVDVLTEIGGVTS